MRLSPRIFCGLIALLLALPACAGLRDIHPRPQQMGLLDSEPLPLAGVPYLVVPDNATRDEILMQEEAQRLIVVRTGMLPEVMAWTSYSGQRPAIWMGTMSRFAALRTALDSVEIAGLGATARSEEYQLVVQADGRILLGAQDLHGLRWGLQSLVALMSEVMGSLYIEQAYVRDWPDFPRRVGTLNSGITVQSQADFAHRILDLSYAARMNEIEWNGSGLWTGRVKPFMQTQIVAMRSKLDHYGQALSMSADATGKSVVQPQWQEGVPVRNQVMRVTSTGALPVANGYPIQIPNGTFETWSGDRPTGWYMYRDSWWSNITRDQTVRHSGTSSLRMTGTPSGGDIRQHFYMGPDKLLKFRLWYRLQNYTGKIRILMLGTSVPRNRWEDRWLIFSPNTTQEWTSYEFEMRTFTADSVMLIIGPYEPASGTIWLDDIVLETGGMEDVLRRTDTPFEVYHHRQNLLLAEGVDYRLVETDTVAYTEYVRLPRVERVAGGRLALGDTIRVNWYCASKMNGQKQIPCFSQLGLIEDYQGRIRRLDSLMHPDGFKIHINEIAYANCDPACSQRGLSPGQLVGRYAAQMYNAIRARRPGAPVRAYGDAFDIYVDDRRSMPPTPGAWNAGALQELPDGVEMMAMIDYSQEIDSSIIFFHQNGHPSVMSVALWLSTAGFVEGALSARRQTGCVGVQYYMWEGDVADRDLPARTMMVGELGWNIGPYFLHTPPVVETRPDSMRITAEIWTDSLLVAAPVSITSATLHYRVLPSGTWTSTPLALGATDRYQATIRNIAQSATGVEYYLSATDHRTQTRKAPADAPQRSFLVSFAGGSSSSGGNGGDEIDFSAREVPGGVVLEWEAAADAGWYEVHTGTRPDFSEASPTRVARQRAECPRLLIPADRAAQEGSAGWRVYAVERRKLPVPSPTPPREDRAAL